MQNNIYKTKFKCKANQNKWVRGVGVSRLLRMQKVLGSNPSGSILKNSKFELSGTALSH